MVDTSSIEPVTCSVSSPPPWEQGYEWSYGMGDIPMGFYNPETGHVIPAEDNMQMVK